jgi:plastocyanin domain-containing protein
MSLIDVKENKMMRIVQKYIFGIVLPVMFLLAISDQLHAQTRKKPVKPNTQTARVLITDLGYSRTSINLRRGVPTRITFLRQTDTTDCHFRIWNQSGVAIEYTGRS